MIQARNLHKRFGKLTVLEDVSFDIAKGGIFAVLGPNGSGKTTIQKLLVSLYHPQEGSILIDNIDIKQLDPSELRKNIAYVSGFFSFPNVVTRDKRV